jgi:hypothetical protein
MSGTRAIPAQGARNGATPEWQCTDLKHV